jgi:hypothetical protein
MRTQDKCCSCGVFLPPDSDTVARPDKRPAKFCLKPVCQEFKQELMRDNYRTNLCLSRTN